MYSPCRRNLDDHRPRLQRPSGATDLALVVGGQSVQPVYALAVEAPAHGTIASQDGSINCGTAGTFCSHSYLEGTNVSLIAVPIRATSSPPGRGTAQGSAAAAWRSPKTEPRVRPSALAPAPSLTINDVTIIEGTPVNRPVTFTVGQQLVMFFFFVLSIYWLQLRIAKR